MSTIQSIYPASGSSDRAVLLINLGSPSSPRVEDVRQYLETFLMDERVISMPPFWRKLLVKGLIGPLRSPRSARSYSKIWDAETQTFPLVRHSAEVAERLRRHLDLTVALAMRYGTPSMQEALAGLAERGVRKLYILPLYPHYTRSSFETAMVHALETHKALGLSMELIPLSAYYNKPSYRQALADSVRPYLSEPFDKLIVSMHGIPLSHLSRPCTACNGATHYCLDRQHSYEEEATCYRLHCERTTEWLRLDLGLRPQQIELVYQSRLGRHEWIKPYFAERVRQWASEGARRIVVVSPAFAVDCLETLEEIDQEYRNTFMRTGGESFTYVPCLNSCASFIEMLAELVPQS